jgi:hypothetical protein
MEKGTLLDYWPTGEGEKLRSLVIHGNMLFSQDEIALTAYPFREAK